jgi:ethanolamine ammonia-lyase large subunit
MKYQISLQQNHFTYHHLREVLAKASPERSADQLAGIGAKGHLERVAAQYVLADIPLKDFLKVPLYDEQDEVTNLIFNQFDQQAFAPISHYTVGEFRNFLLREDIQSSQLQKLKWGLIPEMVAAVSKLMRAQDLISVAKKCEVVTKFRTTVGLRGHLSTRLQPNHPSDDKRGILASILDGLTLGSGDAVVGINPASDHPQKITEMLVMIDQLRQHYQIPMQSCVLTHITTTLDLIHKRCPVDLVFQSIAGSQKANTSFGISLSLLQEAYLAAKELKRGSVGDQVMYFETGQGAALSSESHFGVDAQTMEARAYAVARAYDPFLVNTVVGFIGPEYLYNGKQIIRAGLEDHFCGKLLGLPMGCDVCYTNHAEADQDDSDTLLSLLGMAGVNFIMGVPGGDDIMLHYQSTSFHDAWYLRDTLKLKFAPEFELWLLKMGLIDSQCKLISSGQQTQKILERFHDFAP